MEEFPDLYAKRLEHELKMVETVLANLETGRLLALQRDASGSAINVSHQKIQNFESMRAKLRNKLGQICAKHTRQGGG